MARRKKPPAVVPGDRPGLASEPARFVDGEPANLPAAALDALAWLEWLRNYLQTHDRSTRWDEDRARLRFAAEQLKRFVAPHLPEQYESAPTGVAFVCDAAAPTAKGA